MILSKFLAFSIVQIYKLWTKVWTKCLRGLRVLLVRNVSGLEVVGSNPTRSVRDFSPRESSSNNFSWYLGSVVELPREHCRARSKSLGKWKSQNEYARRRLPGHNLPRKLLRVLGVSMLTATLFAGCLNGWQSRIRELSWLPWSHFRTLTRYGLGSH